MEAISIPQSTNELVIRPKLATWIAFLRDRPGASASRVLFAGASTVALVLSAIAFARGAGPSGWVLLLVAVVIAGLVGYQIIYLVSTKIVVRDDVLSRFHGPWRSTFRVDAIKSILRCSVTVGSMRLPQPIWCFMGHRSDVLFYLAASAWDARDVAQLAAALHVQVSGLWSDHPPPGIRKVMWYAKNA